MVYSRRSETVGLVLSVILMCVFRVLIHQKSKEEKEIAANNVDNMVILYMITRNNL